MSKATERTLKALRDAKYDCEVVEKWKPCGPLCPTCHKPQFGKRHDLFNFCDIVAVRPDVGIVAVQSTVGSGHAAHLSDMKANTMVPAWLRAGGHVVLMSWSKRKMVKKDGKLGKGERWTPRWVEVTLADCEKGGDALE